MYIDGVVIGKPSSSAPAYTAVSLVPGTHVLRAITVAIPSPSFAALDGINTPDRVKNIVIANPASSGSYNGPVNDGFASVNNGYAFVFDDTNGRNSSIVSTTFLYT